MSPRKSQKSTPASAPKDVAWIVTRLGATPAKYVARGNRGRLEGIVSSGEICPTLRALEDMVEG